MSRDADDAAGQFPIEGLLEGMVRAAIRAGAAIMSIYGTDFSVREKSDASPVTEADQLAEKMILVDLAALAPGTPVIAEERVAAEGAPTVGGDFFLVDPLDGTREFVARNGDFTVNIALVRGGRPVLGVVFAPATQQLFAGDVEAGTAFRYRQASDAPPSDQRRRISARVPPAHGLTAVASRSHRTPATESYLAHHTLAELVSVGSSLKFCKVAAGEADLYPRLGDTMEWDTAAGQAVLEAAGGHVYAADGAPLAYGKAGYKNGWFVASGAFVPRTIS